MSLDDEVEAILDFAWADPEHNAAEALRTIDALAEQYPDAHVVTDAGAMIYKLASSVATTPRNITDQVTGERRTRDHGGSEPPV